MNATTRGFLRSSAPIRRRNRRTRAQQLKNNGFAQVLQLARKRFDSKRFGLIFSLTLVICLAVTGAAAFLAGAPGLTVVVVQSLAVAVLVGAGAAWVAAGRAVGGRASITPANDATRPDPAVLDPHSRVLESLEEQGITVKLLELTALGERYGNVFSVAMIGVDHLDDIRDHYDREVTRQLLGKVSSALADTLRMPDRVGELDDGTYLVMLPETDLRGAIQIAERLRAAVSGLDVAASDRVHVHTTASVGVTSFRRGDDLHGLLQRAGKALREAQNQGRNRVLPDLAA